MVRRQAHALLNRNLPPYPGMQPSQAFGETPGHYDSDPGTFEWVDQIGVTQPLPLGGVDVGLGRQKYLPGKLDEHGRSKAAPVHLVPEV